jgi:hypothetical protein
LLASKKCLVSNQGYPKDMSNQDVLLQQKGKLLCLGTIKMGIITLFIATNKNEEGPG